MEDAACECAGQTSPLHPSREDTPPKIHQSQSLERSAATLQERWRKIVVEYSGLGLSFGKDRFPAMSGLAKQQQLHRPNESFVTGLWTGSLLEDLLWRVEKTESEDQRQQNLHGDQLYGVPQPGPGESHSWFYFQCFYS